MTDLSLLQENLLNLQKSWRNDAPDSTLIIREPRTWPIVAMEIGDTPHTHLVFKARTKQLGAKRPDHIIGVLDSYGDVSRMVFDRLVKRLQEKQFVPNAARLTLSPHKIGFYVVRATITAPLKTGGHFTDVMDQVQGSIYMAAAPHSLLCFEQP
ncbi:MAG: hypothetical protein EBZ69_05270 [Alphaproteobacteria bacterium]|nr:hypothetical protein [Alphaproteobacteria bacterium]NDC56204.1 hypothetical protein [Alphaproteobacteria bacterium]